jgi:hypothetical protein
VTVAYIMMHFAKLFINTDKFGAAKSKEHMINLVTCYKNHFFKFWHITIGVNWPTFKAYINLLFIIVAKPPKSLTKPMVSGVFLTQKVCTTTKNIWNATLPLQSCKNQVFNIICPCNFFLNQKPEKL